MGKQEEKIIAMQEQLIKGYEKQIAGLEEENKSLTELNEQLKELLELYLRWLNIAQKSIEIQGRARNTMLRFLKVSLMMSTMEEVSKHSFIS